MAAKSVRNRAIALAVCGLSAPLIYATAAITAGFEYPGYDHLKNFISELGASGSPTAGIMNSGFLAYGILKRFVLSKQEEVNAITGHA